MVGLNRAFLYAGTPTVIASLWNVDDEATALFMERFYTHLQGGMGKAEALRHAQIDLRSQPEFAHPYYWAAFVLTGDGGEISDQERSGQAQTADDDLQGIGTVTIILSLCALGIATMLGMVVVVIRKRRAQREA